MRLYAADPVFRGRQVVTDVLVALWVGAWVLVGRFVHGVVGELGGAGRLLEDGGTDLARAAGGAGTGVDDLPVVGDRLAAPFRAVAEGGAALEGAGLAQQDAVGTLALVLALVVAGLPVAWLLARWLPGRVRWVLQAAAARALLDGSADLRLFALRALTTQPLPRLARVSAAPLLDFERDDPDVVAALATLELGRFGLVAEPATAHATRRS
jgi:hypothetical protein